MYIQTQTAPELEIRQRIALTDVQRFCNTLGARLGIRFVQVASPNGGVAFYGEYYTHRQTLDSVYINATYTGLSVRVQDCNRATLWGRNFRLGPAKQCFMSDEDIGVIIRFISNRIRGIA